MFAIRSARRLATAVRRVLIGACIASMVAGSAMPTYAAGGTSGNVQGTIVDASGNAVRNASVSIASPSQSVKTTTDQNGFFSAVNLPVDTYTVSVASTGFDSLVLRGVTVLGDQTVNIGRQTLAKSTQTIGRTTGRSVVSAFQPNQTTDQVTISGDRVTAATGRQFNVSTQQLALSAPGVTLTGGGNISIRGSRSSDVGYQFEGIDFREPQAYGNAASSFVGLNSLQVVGGSGDATQGNVGSGVVNITVKRGAYPSFGTIDLEGIPFGVQSGTFQGGFEYGTATRDNRISNYVAYINQRNQNQSVLISTPLGGSTFLGCGINTAQYVPANVGCNYATSQRRYSDLIDNFIFRFGKDQNNSLQILYRTRYQLSFGNLGGFTGPTGAPSNYYYNNPAGVWWATNNPYAGGTFSPGYTADSVFAAEVPLLPGTPANPGNTVPGPIESGAAYLNFLDFAFTHNFGSSTSATTRFYNWQSTGVTDRSYGYAASFSGTLTAPLNSLTGGQVTGVNLDITSQIGSRNTLSLSAKMENTHPWRQDMRPTDGILTAEGAFSAGGTIDANQFLSPANTTLPVSATNPCPVPTAVDSTACYLYSYGLANGNLFNGQAVPRLPMGVVDYHQADYQFWGAGIRDQIDVTPNLRIDLGARFDGANYKQSANPYCFFAGCSFNPQDVDPSTVAKQFTNPSIFEPRIAFAYRLTSRDSISGSFGRSVNLVPGQGFGTPAGLYGIPAAYFKIPALDSAAVPECGSGTNTTRFTPSNPTGLVQCQNYAQQLFWNFDQNEDAPDVGGTLPPIYNNYDFSVQHQFKNGMALRLTGFYKRGYNIATLILLHAYGFDPTTGAPTSIIYGGGSNGIERTTGSELYFTLPDRKEGFSGFLTATYINSFSNIPAGSSGEEGVNPLYNASSAANNLLYHVGYISPLTARAGIAYRIHGFRINPIVAYDNGYPIGVGNLTAFGANSFNVGYLNGKPAQVTSTNLGLASPCVYVSSCGTAAATSLAVNYVDPAFPGSYLNPNIAATRGTNEGKDAGALRSHDRLGMDLDLEYEIDKHQTFGMYIGNVFNNPYGLSALSNGLEPFANNRYQAVATGVAGPMTGTNASGFYNGATPVQNAYNGGVVNYPGYDCGYCAYVLPPAGTGRTLRFYYQLKL